MKILWRMSRFKDKRRLCILVKFLPTREGFVEDATFLRTSEGCALVKVLPTCEGLWRMSCFKD